MADDPWLSTEEFLAMQQEQEKAERARVRYFEALLDVDFEERHRQDVKRQSGTTQTET